jgi:type IV pilus assembly protein PilB
MKKDTKKLGEMLMEDGLLDGYQLSAALGYQKQWGGRLASIIINMGFVDEKSIASALEKQLGKKCISLTDIKIPPDAINAVKHDIAVRYSIIPLDFDKRTLTVAMSDPTDLRAIDELSFIIGVRIKPILAVDSGINKAIAKYYAGTTVEDRKIRADKVKKPLEELEVTRNERTEERTRLQTPYPPEILIEALTEVLIEKGIITREKLTNKIREKLKQH